MAVSQGQLNAAAQIGFDQQALELARQQERHLLHVYRKSAVGSGHLAQDFSLDRAFRLVFVRCHFAGGAGANDFHVELRSVLGTAYDARLNTLKLRGTGTDINFMVGRDQSSEPSPWTFQPGDFVRCAWTNPSPGAMTWGLEVGLAVAT